MILLTWLICKLSFLSNYLTTLMLFKKRCCLFCTTRNLFTNKKLNEFHMNQAPLIFGPPVETFEKVSTHLFQCN